jgi:hypothetical protein
MTCNKNQLRFKLLINALYFISLVSIPIVLFALPADFFDNGQTVCLSKTILNRECPGCGMTRGVQHLLHLDFIGAANFNRLSFVVLPLLIFLWLKELWRMRFVLTHSNLGVNN